MVSLGGEGAFPPGSTVQFETALKATITGEVICFDPSLKVLVIKETISGSKPTLRMFNMSMIRDIKELSGPSEKYESIVSSSQQQSDRYSIAEQRRIVEMMEEEVPLEGQQAFVHLRRTLDDVRWKGSDITVLGRVIIKSPYTADNAEVIQNDDQAQSALQHVKKILSKPFVPERKLTGCSPSFQQQQ